MTVSISGSTQFFSSIPGALSSSTVKFLQSANVKDLSIRVSASGGSVLPAVPMHTSASAWKAGFTPMLMNVPLGLWQFGFADLHELDVPGRAGRVSRGIQIQIIITCLRITVSRFLMTKDWVQYQDRLRKCVYVECCALRCKQCCGRVSVSITMTSDRGRGEA